jgi:hypothetical protein
MELAISSCFEKICVVATRVTPFKESNDYTMKVEFQININAIHENTMIMVSVQWTFVT